MQISININRLLSLISEAGKNTRISDSTQRSDRHIDWLISAGQQTRPSAGLA